MAVKAKTVKAKEPVKTPVKTVAKKVPGVKLAQVRGKADVANVVKAKIEKKDDVVKVVPKKEQPKADKPKVAPKPAAKKQPMRTLKMADLMSIKQPEAVIQMTNETAKEPVLVVEKTTKDRKVLSWKDVKAKMNIR